jgi:TRAP transporter, dctM subunit
MIDSITLGYIAVGVMLLLALSGVALPYAMSGVATIGLIMTIGFEGGLTQSLLLIWEQCNSFSLMTIPLFVLMGELAFRTGIVSDLFGAIRCWIGHIPGGLAMSGVVASAAFGAVTGSTAACVATMGSTVMPELEKYHYDRAMSAGSLAGAGGLAALIPPSVVLIIYCVLTDQSIGELFMATFAPGLLTMLFFTLYVHIRCIITPSMGPAGPCSTWKERIASLPRCLPVIIIFMIVIGGMYKGIMTPTEAAGMGVAGVAFIAACMRRLTFENVKVALKRSAVLSTSILFLFIGGWIMARFLVVTGTTKHMVSLILNLELSYYGLLAVLVALFLVLGCVLEASSLLILTMPILFPVACEYGIHPAWFGVFCNLLIVMAAITPPVGINVFMMHGVRPDIPTLTIFRGALPFVGLCILTIVCICVWPELVLYLPQHM